MAWETSTRAKRLPKNWPQLKAATKKRARGKCEAATHVPECTGIGAECDHRDRGDDHSLANLQWLSTPCHKAKSSQENAEANRRRAGMRLRPQERHPGLR